MRTMKAVLLSLAVITTACGGSDDPTGPGRTTLTNGTFSASVNGSAFVPIVVSVAWQGDIAVLSAVNLQGYAVAFGVIAEGPGTYQISSTLGNNASYYEGSVAWQAFGTTGSGTVVLTTLTANRMVGTFNFSLPAVANSGATGVKTVTGGSFDITY